MNQRLRAKAFRTGTLRTRDSIQVRVLVATFVLSLASLLFASNSLRDALLERANAQSLAVTSEVLATLSRMTIDLSLERSLSQVSIELPGVVEALAEREIMADVPHAKLRDEVGGMARAVLVFRETAQKRVTLEADATRERAGQDRRQAAAGRHTRELTDSLAGIMRGLSTAAQRMDAVSRRMAQAAGSIGDLARMTTERAESSAADLATVAQATAQMTSSVDEISDQVSGRRSLLMKAPLHPLCRRRRRWWRMEHGPPYSLHRSKHWGFAITGLAPGRPPTSGPLQTA